MSGQDSSKSNAALEGQLATKVVHLEQDEKK